MGCRVLLSGATGYIGGRLLRRFEEDGRAVRCLVRDPARLVASATTEVVAGDCLDEPSLARALQGIDCAYYLVHSMAATVNFADADRRAAGNFARAAARAGVRRIIYLGGLADTSDALSAHLKSRAETGDILRSSGASVIEFKAAIVVGAGSTSFEMIHALVERLPVMVCPRSWHSNRIAGCACRPTGSYRVARGSNSKWLRLALAAGRASGRPRRSTRTVSSAAPTGLR